MAAKMLGPVRLAGARWAPAAARRLGQEEPAATPDMEIVSAVHTVAAALAAGMSRLEDDYELARQHLPIVFMDDATTSEKMQAISDTAQEMAAIGSSVLEGVLKSYVDQNDYHTISLDIERALKLGRDARAPIGDEPIRPETEAAQEKFFLHHIQDLRDLRDAAQQLVVLAGNGEIPVREPAEDQAALATGTLVAVGAIVVGGLVWLSLS